MLAQTVAAAARDTLRIVDTIRVTDTTRVVDTVWVTQPAHGFVEIATAWSTLAVAFFALVTLFRELWLASQKRRATDAQITAVAYSVQRQLNSWLVAPTTVDIGWARDLSQRGANGKSHFDVAEERFDMLMRDVPFASRRPRRAVYRGFLLFNAATQRINENLADFNRTNSPKYDELRDALKQLVECAAALEGAIDPRLRGEEAKLALKRGP